MLSAFSTETCTSWPTTTRIGGAPNKPSSSTFHPTRSSKADLAAAKPEKFAVVVHVTKPIPLLDGRPSRSSVQSRTIDSALAATGDITCIHAFWSQAPAIQLAASEAGTE